ncbi:RNA:NAD 2'-phosphotransferase (TPT1/KptA family) [Microbacterium paludicola]|uniref:RNA:NAD 2'-phosphotransferase (TPT1/KptA family) n=1 Tax=Microbacterium paludicola TaxID=300019 RepID=A0ABU1HYR1_9MICO|nr:RNA 2'-phosphotransferase [Microbacterium paludicola]MDR6166780.1 RNA:NAD 2'-phosphotransferase (TPT1/KptA family) [Microbacterium paludicola]
MTAPSPADVAAQLSKKRSLGVEHAIAAGLEANFPAVTKIVKTLGLDPRIEVEKWLDTAGLHRVKLWSQPGTDPSALVREWNQLKDEPPTVLSALIAEHRIGDQGSEIGPYLHSSATSYAAELVNARWRTARALKARAGAVPYFEQIVLARTCNLARAYYQSLRPFATNDDPTRSASKIEWEVAKLTVTAARFNSSTGPELDDALRYLNARLDERLDIQAAAFKLEVLIEQYHISGNYEHLREAIQFSKSVTVPEDDWPLWHVSCAEAYLDLAQHAASSWRSDFVRKAYDTLNVVLQNPIENVTLHIRAKLLRALARYCMDFPTTRVALRNVRLPFLLRTAGPLPPIVLQASGYLINSIQGAADRGQYQHREFLAELVSRISADRPPADRAQMLREAIRLRDPVESKLALEGTRDLMAQALDLFSLYAIERQEEMRTRAIDILLSLHLSDPTASEPLVLLARNIEMWGADRRLRRGLETTLSQAIQNGDHRAILARAAGLAFKDQTLRVSGLGGRGKTYTVADFSGFTGATFVFKSGAESALVRDEQRARGVEGLIADKSLTDAFGVIEHIDKLSILPSSESASELVSVRRYARGDTLRYYLDSRIEPEEKRLIVERTARFLALIHGAEPPTEDECRSARREMKLKELGRWLKRLLPREEASAMFVSWWSMMSHVPLLPRRDAHSLNWIVSSSGRILAADLESKGARPVVYELAQLIEDHPVFTPSDDVPRYAALDAYLQSLGCELGSSRDVYDACAAARSVAVLTDPHSSERSRDYAFKRLLHIASGERGEEFNRLGSWAQTIVEAWRLKVGLTDPGRFKSIAPADRIRISKAMSFHLRHDPSAPVTRGGWIFANDLADILRRNGHKVTPEQLLVIAGALGEPRFQLDKSEIRAAYGHSKVKRGDFDTTAPPPVLFHATETRNMAAIFAGRSGLLPKSRQFVHLTPEPENAEIAARRHGPQTFLLSLDPTQVPDLVCASTDTWLASSVPVSALRVPTIAELWLEQREGATPAQ